MKKLKIYALVLFLITLFSCITKNAVSGRKSVNVISPEQEVQMGEEAYRKVLAEEPLSKNRSDIERLNQVSRKLVHAVGNDMPQAVWEFKVIESEEINAFALPGGKVAIYSALLHIINDDELAYVLGHEIAHVTCRHGTERVSQQILLQVGASAIAALLKQKSPKTTNAFLAAYGLGSQVGITLPFSRKNELEADKYGTYYSARAGYDPEASISTLKKFTALAGERPKLYEFFSTHPLDKSRISALESEMPKFKKEYLKHKVQ